MSGLSHLHRLVVAAVTVTLLTASVLVSPGIAQPVAAPSLPSMLLSSTTPTQVFPIDGVVIPIKRIIYVWTAVPSATQYRLQVYRDATLLLNTNLGAAVCVSGTCTFRHDIDLANGTYNWRVRATVGGVAQAFSPSQYFVVSMPVTGFYSPFTSNAVDWVIHKGLWNLESSNYFTTLGVASSAATISHLGDYSTLTFEVRMRRAGCASCSNVIAIRGNPVLDSTGWWNTEYTFNYTNTGLFSVWKDSYGSYTPLQNWISTAAIVQGDWNTLKVIADGPYLYFYINNILIWTGWDSAYASGRVGIGMYRNASSTGDKLWVDWAQLSTTANYGPNQDLLAVTEEGQEAPGGDRNMAP